MRAVAVPMADPRWELLDSLSKVNLIQCPCSGPFILDSLSKVNLTLDSLSKVKLIQPRWCHEQIMAKVEEATYI